MFTPSSACFGILFDTNLPRGAQSACQQVLVRKRKFDVRGAHPPPSAAYGNKHIGLFRHKVRLLLRREHKVSEALILRCERSEYSAAHTEIGRSHVGAFFSAR